jgi:hypothetical protein
MRTPSRRSSPKSIATRYCWPAASARCAASPPEKNWTARLFVYGRRLLGLRLKVMVLLATERQAQPAHAH